MIPESKPMTIKTTANDIVISTRLDADHRHALKVAAAIRGVDMSGLMKEAIRPYILEGMRVLSDQAKDAEPAKLQVIDI